MRSNRAIDAAEAKRKAAILLTEQRKKAAPARGPRRRPHTSIRIPVGASLTLNGPTAFGEIKHVGRRRYFAVSAEGGGAGQFTNARRALKALAVGPERVRRRRNSSSNAD